MDHWHIYTNTRKIKIISWETLLHYFITDYGFSSFKFPMEWWTILCYVHFPICFQYKNHKTSNRISNKFVPGAIDWSLAYVIAQNIWIMRATSVLYYKYSSRAFKHVSGQCSNTVSGFLAPVPLSIFRSNSKFDENSKHSSVKYTRPITTIFCTRHDSVTVVTCAKYRCDRSNIYKTRAFWIFVEFRIRSKYA